MQVIALTGGIASGKSLVAARLEELGAVHVDADVLAREVVAPGTEGLAAIAEHFGDRVIGPDGALDRPALGAIVFSDPAERQVLNDVTHPRVWRRATQLIADAEAGDPDAVVVYDVPLLVEGGAARHLHFDLVVVVQADRAERIRRLVDLRGMGADEAERRIAAQAGDDERLAVADVVIDNSASVPATLAQVDALWARLTAAG